MKKEPLISIITVVYNGEKHLQQTINSVYKQTYKNIEYIIVDGNSSDGTLDIIKQNESKITKWISEPDKGLYDAMNKGIKMASGELIGMINSDDWYEINAVEMTVNHYHKNPDKRIFHGNIKCIDERNHTFYVKKPKNSSFLLKYHAMTLNHPSMFVHQEIYSLWTYNTSLKSLSDYQFTLEVFLNNQRWFHYIPKLMSNFRLGGVSGKISNTTSIIENFKARRNAGMSLGKSLFALMFRIGFILFKYVRK
jgi:glycosyltransferase involved in cell wall biosynthesis